MPSLLWLIRHLITGASPFLGNVDPLVDLLAVLSARTFVGCITGLVQALINLRVVVTRHVLGLLHEIAHAARLPPSRGGLTRATDIRLPGPVGALGEDGVIPD